MRESSGSALEGTPAMQNLRSSRMRDPSEAAAGAEHTGEIPAPCGGRRAARDKPPSTPHSLPKSPSGVCGRLWNAGPTVPEGFVREGPALASGGASNRGRDLRLLGLSKLPGLPGDCGGAKALLRWK